MKHHGYTSLPTNYNPSDVGVKGSLFGLPFTEEESSVIILPIPWDATVSYHEGTANGPNAILDASSQLDLESPNRQASWKRGIWMMPVNEQWKQGSQSLRILIEPYITQLENGMVSDNKDLILKGVNDSTSKLNNQVYEKSKSLLDQGKLVGVLGGDHSCPLGYIEALAEKFSNFGILQIDAHMDLRDSYEGFTHSHASIMNNVLKIKQVSKLVQVGVRDFCQEELERVKGENDRVHVFFDSVVKDKVFKGENWDALCGDIVLHLPQYVYVSFDIDGLNPHLCPGTGTPVPGGLEYAEAIHLIRKIKESGKQIIGFDLCEVAPRADDHDWNANVGARVLYELCAVIG